MTRVLCVGQAVQDFVFGLESMPTAPTKYGASSFTSIGGGPAATAAVAIARLGGTATLAARLGEDLMADLLVSELEAYGVDCRLMRRYSGKQSSVSAVVVDARGERMIVNYLDPELPADPHWLAEGLAGEYGAVLADTRWPQGAAFALRRAKAAGLPAILDADIPVPADTELLRCASHLAFSADGLADYAGHRDYEAALLEVAAETQAWCCVTLGGEGVLHVLAGETPQFPAFPVKPVDSLGAGDVWHGAFALKLAEGESELQSIAFASAAAAIKVQRGGGRAGTPTRNEVDDFISKHAPRQP